MDLGGVVFILGGLVPALILLVAVVRGYHISVVCGLLLFLVLMATVTQLKKKRVCYKNL